jgi:hypothetical protein
MLPEQWRTQAGKTFRETLGSVSEYSKKDIRIRERLEEAPDVLWNTAKVKSSEALRNAAEEENKRIASELARQTLTDKARQEKATADRMETEARISKIKEIEERVALVEKLRAANSVPVWDARGNMKILKAPLGYDWDGLTAALLQAADLALPIGSETDDHQSGEGKIQPSTDSTAQISGTAGIPSNEGFGKGVVSKGPEP